VTQLMLLAIFACTIHFGLKVDSYRLANRNVFRQLVPKSKYSLYAVLNLRQAVDVIKEKVILSQIVGNYVKDMRSYGSTAYQCLCPFHDDRSPSMSVTDDKGLYYCHACSSGGDIFKFVENIEKCNFKTAVEHIIDLADLDIEIDSSESDGGAGRQGNYRNRRILEALSKASRFYMTRMYDPGAGAARRHLMSRRILPQTATKFQIGYAPQSYYSRDKVAVSLIGNLTSEGFTPRELVSAGLAIDKSPYQNDASTSGNAAADGMDPAYAEQQLQLNLATSKSEASSGSPAAPPRDTIYDRFRGRLMVPIKDEYGNVIAFGGRILDDGSNQGGADASKSKSPIATAKYINSPETDVFKKGSNLFGLDLAKRAIAREGEAIIVEGYFDVIALHDVGGKNHIWSS
jgi:DNA primase